MIVRRILGPLLAIFLCPPVTILIWYTNFALDGSVLNLWMFFKEHGFFPSLSLIWSPVFWGSATAWTLIGCFAMSQLLLMRYVPGKQFEGPITPHGNIPLYRANGPACFFITLGTFCMLSFGLNCFPASLLYDHLGEIIGALNLLSFSFCLFLYFKGRFFPSSSDAGSTGNFLFDFYWGTELYPRIAGLDLKRFTNCRFGMMSWPLLLISYAAKQEELFGITHGMLIAVFLQLLYIGKFFLWETGYLRSLDIMHDRAGFYICWGCMVFVPSLYTSATLYLVQHPVHLSNLTALCLLAIGSSAILINYLADRQRQNFRASAGNCLIWGKRPLFTRAAYTTTQGQIKENLLLCSGWWGISRHFHYLPEIIGALCWSLPALFNHFLPYFYVVFLSVLLIDRAIRDDQRCSTKYKEVWKTHCQKVPYRILPYFW